MKIKKGDKVLVTAGKDRGKEGTVERVWLEERKVSVAGVNIYKRHTKARSGQDTAQKGGIVDFVRPLPVANVALVCSKCHETTRVGYEVSQNLKRRVCRKCGAEIK